MPSLPIGGSGRDHNTIGKICFSFKKLKRLNNKSSTDDLLMASMAKDTTNCNHDGMTMHLPLGWPQF